MSAAPISVHDLQELIQESVRVLPRGGGTKPTLSTTIAGTTAIKLSEISGLIEYEPDEFTFSARAGTRLSELQPIFEDQGQYMPFDPPLVESGATLGGAVAAGLSGPGRYRHGGVRDFVLGVKFLDGSGNMLSGGGKVVKNAAGFDLPKLMVGSLGSLGVMIELTLKLLPKPAASATLKIEYPKLDDALQDMYRLFPSPLDIDALEMEVADSKTFLWVRMAGSRKALSARQLRLKDMIGKGEYMDGGEEEATWKRVRELEWIPKGWALVKAPITPGRIKKLEDGLVSLTGGQIKRRYSCGGQSAWLAVEGPMDHLNELLASQKLSGLVLIGPPGNPWVGSHAASSFGARIKRALDPSNRFMEF